MLITVQSKVNKDIRVKKVMSVYFILVFNYLFTPEITQLFPKQTFKLNSICQLTMLINTFQLVLLLNYECYENVNKTNNVCQGGVVEGEKGLKGLVTLISELSDLPKSFQGSNRNYYIRHFRCLFPTPTFVLCKCCTVYYQHTMFL